MEFPIKCKIKCLPKWHARNIENSKNYDDIDSRRRLNLADLMQMNRTCKYCTSKFAAQTDRDNFSPAMFGCPSISWPEVGARNCNRSRCCDNFTNKNSKRLIASRNVSANKSWCYITTTWLKYNMKYIWISRTGRSLTLLELKQLSYKTTGSKWSVAHCDMTFYSILLKWRQVCIYISLWLLF